MLAKGMNGVINAVAKDRGSNLSGEKALLIDPQMVSHFKNVDPAKVIFITGTNGKSSSTNLVTHILRSCGKRWSPILKEPIFSPVLPRALLRRVI